MPAAVIRKPTQADLDAITVDKIVQVYSGKQGCMCGCNGKYWKSGKMLGKVLAILKADPRVMLQDEYILYIDFPQRNNDERSYVLYLQE